MMEDFLNMSRYYWHVHCSLFLLLVHFLKCSSYLLLQPMKDCSGAVSEINESSNQKCTLFIPCNHYVTLFESIICPFIQDLQFTALTI